MSSRKTLYVYIPGLYPYGLLYCTQVAAPLLSIKGQDAIIYQRRSTDLDEEFANFEKFIEIFKKYYTHFIIIGHSYGAVYAKYFCTHLPSSLYVSLDGSDLKETCEYVAYDLLKLNRSEKIEYDGEYPTCAGKNLIEEFFKTTVKATIKDYGKDITEVSWQEWVHNTRLVSELHPQNSIMFTYFPNPDEPSKLKVNKRGLLYEICLGKNYCHSLHMDTDVCKAILDIIDEYDFN